MSRAVALSMVPTGGHSGAARTAGVPLTDAALTPTFLTTSADQMTSTLTSALATEYVNLRGVEDLYHKKRSGGEGDPGLPFLLITGNSPRGIAGAQPGAPQGHGKAEDLEMRDSPGTPRTHAFEGAEKKGGVDPLSSSLELFVCCPHKVSFSLVVYTLHILHLGFFKKLCFLTFMWFFLSLQCGNHFFFASFWLF